jgi:hypothetical protein
MCVVDTRFDIRQFTGDAMPSFGAPRVIVGRHHTVVHLEDIVCA